MKSKVRPSAAASITWVTGASSGLGRSLALALAEQGHRVIASARDVTALASLERQNPSIFSLPCDITDETSLASARATIAANFPCLDQVILNAGSCEYLDFPEPDWPAVRRVMEINYFGTINCLQQALPLLRRSGRKRPYIVVIASQVTNAPFARAEAYGASKAALQYFFDSLRIDLARENIDITVVNPGFVDTPLTRRNDFDMPFLMSADEAASRILGKMRSRPWRYDFPRRLGALLFIARLLPAAWQKMVAPAARESDENCNPDQQEES